MTRIQFLNDLDSLEQTQANTVECCRCHDWVEKDDCTLYRDGYVCDDCKYAYLAAHTEYAKAYIDSDPEITADFYWNWWFGNLPQADKLAILKRAFASGQAILSGWSQAEEMEEFARCDDGFPGYVAQMLEACHETL